MIDQWEAELIASSWLYQDKPVGVALEPGVHEFDLGFVFWRQLPLGEAVDIGSGRIVVDRDNGELTYWPSVPPTEVAEQYRAFRREVPVAPLTWDPVVRAEHDRLRASFPENVTHLRLADGRLRMSRSMKGSGTPNLHPLVREFLAELPVPYRERGNDRCSEVAALSDALHAEDARRAANGEAPTTLAEARGDLLRGADLVTYRVREPGDPTGGQPAPPCVSCRALLGHLGFALQSPEATDE
jgi:hypothetical protein